MDADSPVLWLRVDPDLLLVRKIDLHQPVNQWEYQLKYEKDVLAQLQSLETLPRFPSPQTRHTILEVIENDNIFYRFLSLIILFDQIVRILRETIGCRCLCISWKEKLSNRGWWAKDNAEFKWYFCIITNYSRFRISAYILRATYTIYAHLSGVCCKSLYILYA